MLCIGYETGGVLLMKMISLKCPHCNANLEVQDSIDSFFCMYCGSKVMIEGMSKDAYKAKVKIKALEFLDRASDKRNEQKRFILNNLNEERRRQDKSTNQALLGMGIFILLIFGLVLVPGIIGHKNNIKELKETESQLSQAIINEDYDLALILANQLYYTGDWSSEVEEAWNTKRENYIAIIEEKQGKKAK